MSDLVPEAENVIDPTNLLDESKRLLAQPRAGVQ